MAIFPVVKDYQQKISAKVKEQIALLMKQKKYQEVLKLTKKAVEFEKTLN